MKVYISGPMTGLPEFNYPKFDTTAEMLRSKGYDVRNPADYGRSIGIENFAPRLAFKQYAEWICDADAIWMLPGWEKSVGARAEHALAVAVGCRVIYIDEQDTEQWPSRSRPLK